MTAEEYKYTDKQTRHQEEGAVEHGIIFPVEWVRVRLVLRKTLIGRGMTLLARAQNVRRRKPGFGIGGGQYIMMAMAVITGSYIGCHIGFAERHGFAVVGIPIM